MTRMNKKTSEKIQKLAFGILMKHLNHQEIAIESTISVVQHIEHSQSNNEDISTCIEPLKDFFSNKEGLYDDLTCMIAKEVSND
jgi:hypothetical protein